MGPGKYYHLRTNDREEISDTLLHVVSKKLAVMPEHPHGSLDINHTELNKFASSEDSNCLKVRREIENELSFGMSFINT